MKIAEISIESKLRPVNSLNGAAASDHVNSTPYDAKGARHVMFVLTSLSVGGSERKTVRIANAMVRQGWDVTLAYLDPPHSLRGEIENSVNTVFLERKGKFSFGALRRLIAYIAREHVNVVCCINLYPLIYAFIARLYAGSVSFRLLATTNETHFVRKKDGLKMYLYAPMLRRVDRVIFGSSYQRDFWVQKYRLNQANCSYIYNGVDLNIFRQSETDKYDSSSIRRSLKIPDTGLLIGSVGRFRKEKQYQVLIQACVDIKKKKGIDIYCLLVGGGFKEQQLKDKVSELNCGDYVFLLDAADDVRPYLEAMDIFALSSISETFSNAALEAMAMGVPVVLPDVGGCPEMVSPGVNGYIYEAGKLEQFAKYVCMLSNNDKQRLAMGHEARRYVEERFQFKAMVDSYERLIEQAL